MKKKLLFFIAIFFVFGIGHAIKKRIHPAPFFQSVALHHHMKR